MAQRPESFAVRCLQELGERDIQGLADVLIDCVEGGASVSFLAPLTRARAAEFWRRIAAGVARGEVRLLIAEDAHGIAGTVQLALNLPENQPHRADLAKMLVHRRARQCGVGGALLAAAEAEALAAGRTVLVLDTASAEAARLYARHGWQRVGVVPAFALMPDGAPCATTFFYKQLA
jgi:GNAT superfamily N-acetyltransferase